MSQESYSRDSLIISKALTQDWFWHGLKCCKPWLGKGECHSQPAVSWENVGITSPSLWFPSRKWVALYRSSRSLSRAVWATSSHPVSHHGQRIMNMSWLLGLNVTRSNFWCFCIELPVKAFFCHCISSWHLCGRAQQLTSGIATCLVSKYSAMGQEWATQLHWMASRGTRGIKAKAALSSQGLSLTWLRAVTACGSHLGKRPMWVEFLMLYHKHSRVVWLSINWAARNGGSRHFSAWRCYRNNQTSLFGLYIERVFLCCPSSCMIERV